MSLSSNDSNNSQSNLGLAGLGSLTPPGGFSVPPPSPSSSNSSSNALGGFVPPPPRPAFGKEELYLYGYGKQFGEKLTYSAGVGYATGKPEHLTPMQLWERR